MDIFLPVAAIVFIILAMVIGISYLIDRSLEHHEREND